MVSAILLEIQCQFQEIAKAGKRSEECPDYGHIGAAMDFTENATFQDTDKESMSVSIPIMVDSSIIPMQSFYLPKENAQSVQLSRASQFHVKCYLK
jgi:hypothetical protein